MAQERSSATWMPEAFSEALQHQGIFWLWGIAAVAGLVRGFAGFGSAMMYMPAASAVLGSPVAVYVSMVVFDVIGPLPNVPRALRDCNKGEVVMLAVGLLVGLPIGLSVLTRIPAEPFRWTVALMALALLALLLSGWRYRAERTPPVTVGTGVVGGALSGSTGMAGAPALLLYLAGREETARIRANMILYLLVGDVISLTLLGAAGALEVGHVALGLVIAPAYLAGNVVGGLLFTERAERFYRFVAYSLIGASALFALPILGWRLP